MKTWAFAMVLSLVAIGQGFSQTTTKVSDVVEMSQGGIADDIIIAKLRKENHPFDLSPQEMVQLKKQGISDGVIKVMIDPTAVAVRPPVSVAPYAGTVISTGSNSTDPNDPMSPHKQGIWLYVENKMAPLPIAAMKEMKVSGFMPLVVNPFGRVKEKTVFIGQRSDLRTPANPTFYFYGYDDMRHWSLAKLDQKKDTRELTNAAIGVTSASTTNGVRDKDLIQLHSEQVSNNVYKVTVNSSLKPGEYCFVSQMSALNPFDFGVDR